MTTTPNARNQAVIEEFRTSEGRVGGGWEGRPLLLLTTTGAKSARQHTTPLMYHHDGDNLYVFASMGGAPSSPAWFHNLSANSRVTVERGSERFEARAVVLSGAERDRIYAIQGVNFPQFAEYQEKTARTIPVVQLVREG